MTKKKISRKLHESISGRTDLQLFQRTMFQDLATLRRVEVSLSDLQRRYGFNTSDWSAIRSTIKNQFLRAQKTINFQRKMEEQEKYRNETL